MRLEVHHKIPEDPQSRRAWNTLAQEMDCPEVFYTWEWAKAIEAAYAKILLPWLALAWEGDQLVGIASLALKERRAEFLANTTADYCDFISAPGCRTEFIDAVFAKLRGEGCTEVVLANLPADSMSATAVPEIARTNNFHTFMRLGYECARVRLGTSEEREKMPAVLSKKKLFRKVRNALSREAALSLRHASSWAEVEPLIPAFARTHVARFLSIQRTSNLMYAERRWFLSELARLLCQSGWLCLTRLMWGDRAIGWNFGFRFNGSWFWYQPTIDSRFEEYSPGRLLLGHMVMEACATPELQLVDLGLGAEGYKEHFANEIRRTLHVTASSSIVRTAGESVRYRTAETIKRSPRLESGIRRNLSRVGSVRRRLQEGSPRDFAVWASGVVTRSIVSTDEVRFYRWSNAAAASSVAKAELFCPLEFDTLAQAAMDSEADPETVTYLLRAAQRLKSGQNDGFVLLDTQEQPVHFCWSGEFEGFGIAELQTRLSAPTPNARLIFDCWTPTAFRGLGYYPKAIARLAHRLQESGQVPWIFSAAGNTSSVHGIEKAGFEYQYSMISKKTPAGRKVITVPTNTQVDAPVRS